MTPSPQPIADAQAPAVATHQPPLGLSMPGPAPSPMTAPTRVVITDVNIPFTRLFWIVLKLALVGAVLYLIRGLIDAGIGRIAGV